MKTLTLKTANGDRSVAAKWTGDNVAVHKPITKNGESKLPRFWAISHLGSGLACCPPLDATLADARKLAKLWDKAFGTIDPKDASSWPFKELWRDDLQRLTLGKEIIGPRQRTPLERLDSAGTFEEVSRAVAEAMGHTFSGDADASEPFPVAETVPVGRRRAGQDDWPEMLWRGKWWPVPTLGDVEAWALDSACETPDGRTVETDHPEAWTRLLGVV